MKSRWCVFSHISLFPNAAMLHSFGVTLILFWKIPLIFDVARNTKKKMKMLSSVKNTDAIFYVLTLRYPGPSAEHASLFPCLMQHIQSELMKTPRMEWVLLALPPRRVVKEIESNGGTAILSLPYRLFINLTIRSDACLLLESVHTHSILTSTYQLAIICFSVQGWLTANAFSFWHCIIQ